MTNGVLVSEVNQSLSVLLSSTSIGKKGRASSTDAASKVRRAKGSRQEGGRMIDQSLLAGLLDPKTSSLSLTALVQAAAFSGKRLVLEIRDENPVQIVRTPTRGM